MNHSIKKWALGTSAAALFTCASAVAVQASDLSGEITVWSWDIGAKSLVANIEGFNKKHPNVKVTVEEIGNQQVYDRFLAGCAAGGVGLPDVLSVENRQAEIFWSRFPDCTADLSELGFTEEVGATFAPSKRIELEVGGSVNAMPWDAGPVMMFYRRDYYENAGIDPASIETWDDFIAAGKKVQEANPDVIMTQANLGGATEFFEMIGQQNGCTYFNSEADAITVASTACAQALAVIEKLRDEGVVANADWGTKIQSMIAGNVATQMYGGWYEGTIRTQVPEDQFGKWGVYRMPAVNAGGTRAANFGGSALAITQNSQNKEAAFAYLMHAAGSVEGQITSMREYGLVPSMIAAVQDPYVTEGQPFWNGQKIWVETLETLPEIIPVSGTQFYGDASTVLNVVQTGFLNGDYDSAEAALDDAAKRIAVSTGLAIQ